MKRRIIGTLAVSLLTLLSSTTVFAQQKEAVCAAQENRPTELPGQRVGKKVQKAFELYNQEDSEGALAILKEIDAKKGFDRAFVDRFIGNLMAAKGGEEATKAIPYLERAFEANKLNATEHASVIKLLAQLNMMDKQFQKAINMYQEWMRFTCKQEAADYLAIAQAYYFMKKMDAIIAPADKAISLYEKPNKQPYILKMSSYYERKMYKKAIEVVAELVRIYPDDGQWWTRLGFFYMLDENYKKATYTLDIAYNKGFLTKESEIKTLASLYSQQGSPYKAGKILEDNLKKGIVKREAKMLATIANSFHAAKELKSAAKYYGEAAKMEKDAEYYRKQGTLLLQAESYKSAATALKKALELGSPKKGSINMALMETYFYRQDFKNAYVYINEAIKDKKTRRNAKAWKPYIKEKARNRGIKL